MDSLSQLALGSSIAVAVMGRRTAVWNAAESQSSPPNTIGRSTSHFGSAADAELQIGAAQSRAATAAVANLVMDRPPGVAGAGPPARMATPSGRAPPRVNRGTRRPGRI